MFRYVHTNIIANDELVTADYPNDTEAVFVYARDPECNIIELQSWRQRL